MEDMKSDNPSRRRAEGWVGGGGGGVKAIIRYGVKSRAFMNCAINALCAVERERERER